MPHLTSLLLNLTSPFRHTLTGHLPHLTPPPPVHLTPILETFPFSFPWVTSISAHLTSPPLQSSPTIFLFHFTELALFCPARASYSLYAVQCSGVHCIVMHFTPLTPECESQTDAIGVGSSWVGPRTNGSLPSLWALRLSLAKPNMVWLTRCPRVGRLTPALVIVT